MRRTLIALAVMLAMVACGGDDAEPPASSGTDDTSSAPEATATWTTGETAPLNGSWVATGITPREIGRAIEAEGFGDEEIEVFLGDFGDPDSLDLTWNVQGETYDLVAVSDGEDLGVVDSADLVVDGDTVTYRYYSGGSSTLRWTIQGDRLELELLEDTQPDVKGISTDVFVAALYASVPWERAA
jgi:hypothetical protein